jgi:hypothetical protein
MGFSPALYTLYVYIHWMTFFKLLITIIEGNLYILPYKSRRRVLTVLNVDIWTSE